MLKRLTQALNDNVFEHSVGAPLDNSLLWVRWGLLFQGYMYFSLNLGYYNHSEWLCNPLLCWQDKQFLNFVLGQLPSFPSFAPGMKNSVVNVSDRRPAEMCISPEVEGSKVLHTNPSVGTREKVTHSCLSLVGILWLRHQFHSGLPKDK